VAAAVLADALVTGIHAGDPDLLSARAAFPRLVAWEAQYGSVMKGMAQAARQRRKAAKARGEPYRRGSRMWSFRQGLRLAVETLTGQLVRPPLLGVCVRRLLCPGAASWTVQGEGQDQWTADVVVLACPAYEQATLLADVDAELAERIAGIAYNRIAVLALGYRREDVPINLDGFGFIAPQHTRRDLLGAQWCSSIYPERAPDGFVLLRVLCGGWHRPEVVAWTEAQLVEAVRSELKLAMRIDAAPLFRHLVRWERAIPQYQIGHLERVARIRQRARHYPGLFLAGNAYDGIALNDCTEQAEILAGQVAAYLAS
jgi:oxygen-dependent protoporphyrinogen oxidase